MINLKKLNESKNFNFKQTSKMVIRLEDEKIGIRR